jgi:hypothetical protein
MELSLSSSLKSTHHRLNNMNIQISHNSSSHNLLVSRLHLLRNSSLHLLHSNNLHLLHNSNLRTSNLRCLHLLSYISHLSYPLLQLKWYHNLDNNLNLTYLIFLIR